MSSELQRLAATLAAHPDDTDALARLTRYLTRSGRGAPTEQPWFSLLGSDEPERLLADALHGALPRGWRAHMRSTTTAWTWTLEPQTRRAALSYTLRAEKRPPRLTLLHGNTLLEDDDNMGFLDARVAESTTIALYLREHSLTQLFQDLLVGTRPNTHG